MDMMQQRLEAFHCSMRTKVEPRSQSTAPLIDVVGEFALDPVDVALLVSITLDSEFRRGGRSSGSKIGTGFSKGSLLLVSRDFLVLEFDSFSSSAVFLEFSEDSFVKVEPSSQSTASLIDVVGEFTQDPDDVASNFKRG